MITRASTTLTMLAILILGIWLYLHDLTTVGDIVTFMGYATLMIGKLEQVVHFANHMVMEGPRLQEFFDVLDTVPTVRDRPDAVDPGRMRGLIEFKDVSYSYDGKRAAVADLSFTALPGETVALVGATGAGKSTALALLHRAFDPQSGAVKIDGVDIRAFTLSGLRRNIGVVFQEVLLFNRSVAENLRVGKPDATEAEMRSACERAQVLEVIERNPEGFEAVAGERGRMFSGGERQRLSIARALLKDPPILILDEATSALDALTEAKVQAALAEVMKNRTTFVIAHRLATIRNATRILVFQGGRVIESGSFDELIRLRRAFRRIRPHPVHGRRHRQAAARAAERSASGNLSADHAPTSAIPTPMRPLSSLGRRLGDHPLKTVFALALLVRLANLALLGGREAFFAELDTHGYWALGAALANPASFASALLSMTDRMPLYPLLLGGVQSAVRRRALAGRPHSSRIGRRHLHADRGARRTALAAGRIDRRHRRRAVGQPHGLQHPDPHRHALSVLLHADAARRRTLPAQPRPAAWRRWRASPAGFRWPPGPPSRCCWWRRSRWSS